MPPVDRAFVRCHSILFANENLDILEPAVGAYLGLLVNQITQITEKFVEQGFYIAATNIVAMLGYGSKENLLMKAIQNDSPGVSDSEVLKSSKDPMIYSFLAAKNLTNKTLIIVLEQIGDPNVLSFILVTLVFVYFMSSRGLMSSLETGFPWLPLTKMLNSLLDSYYTVDRIENEEFPIPVKDHVRPLPEEFRMREFLWVEGCYPKSWFSHEIDDDERNVELASMVDDRVERILWFAYHIASAGSWIYFDRETRRFSTSPSEAPQNSRLVRIHQAVAGQGD